MARVAKKIHICDRDALGKEKPATSTRSFSVEGTDYRLRLCEQHAVMFDREMFGWSRLAEEVGHRSATFGAEFAERARQAAELRARQTADCRPREDQLPASKPVVSHRPHRLGVPVAAEDVQPGERYSNGWMIHQHAADRGEQRGYDTHDILTAATQPEIAYDDLHHGKMRRIHQKGECAVVVNPADKVVVTVLHRDEAKYALDHHHHLSERVAR